MLPLIQIPATKWNRRSRSIESLNGLKVNGLKLNGLKVNGFKVNGFNVNGFKKS
jgi:hypothetical protein